MKRLILFTLLLFLAVGIKAQLVGINTDDPKSTLHIAESSITDPTGKDGLLAPRVTNFPATDPLNAGNLIFLRKDATSSPSIATKPDGFYYWNGNEWVLMATRSINTNEYRTLYCAYGQGYLGADTDMGQRGVILGSLVYDASKEESDAVFSLADNVFTVGKGGTYLLSFVTSSRRYIYDSEGTPPQFTNLFGEVLINGASANPRIMAKGNTAGEKYSACHIVINTIVSLEKGDKLTAIVQLTDRGQYKNLGGGLFEYVPVTGGPPPSYGSNGVSSLTLTYLHK
ncbi:hypothetical protein [Dysgonomonas sp. 520]|uniref:hypothetical protein n=1 Tax=Dysgonomonas sp. 520 TaxID=2302931 RepID=UPI0013D0CBB8|nr:hypothetical protein [Dysgonomonas sp. 520]NDW08483.1 hypothetical protein [Dysgonomonas sp. 520]